MNIKNIVFAALLIASLPASAGEWYEGGTLHKATAAQWHKSTPQNQVATSADFIAALKAASDMQQLKHRSFELSICITEATSDESLMSQKVPDIAVLCALQLNYK